ncbi:MAG: phosphoribosylformylglycinamidine synthase subunit PurL [Deltaproteobacteria bacterium]|jgi:phosphoribosylformylglycinamidine synthase|nr:phosphoribosylformylglycinamidine synthase subunit PurL [Deltaproteobacteria bacterium]MBW2537453.1 phosphoribosylformylglycinamidine synthase subunit PurL [Deltaproteobacteria bacterium]
MTERPVAFPNDPAVSTELAADHKLSSAEYTRILEALRRDPTYAELGVLSVMWSEHCSYKSSRVHLARLPTEGPRVIQGPGENAGIVDIGDGYAAVFKMESHNHPSYIEPYQGAATGVGGIVRDVFTMGARPIASLNSLRFGRPDHPRTPELLRGVVAGIGGYGNCIGVPTVGGELSFDGAYDGNILVNAFACGVAPIDGIFYGRATGVGNPVLYVGAKTGRDGIHGATMASDEFSEGGPSQRPTVQVGDPFMEKLLIEACLEIFAEDLLIGIQDMGAAGLTSSSVEMASRSGSGLDLDLDRVPRRAKNMSPYEMLLSESQERMLLVTKRGKEARVREICDRWGLDAATVGFVTQTGRWVVRATPGYDPLAADPPERDPVVVCDLPVDLLTDKAPKYDRPQAKDTHPAVVATAERRAFDPSSVAEPSSWTQELLAALASPNVGSRAWVWRQYDHIVRGGTRVRPGADAAVVRVPCARGDTVVDKLLAFASDADGPLCELDPYEGGAKAVAEACRNLACVGARVVGLTDCLNFGSPERPEVMRQFARAIDGMVAACKALHAPVVSGNVSFYNETDGRAVLPTPTVAAVGLIERPAWVTEPWWPHEGCAVLLLGPTRGGPLGGSEYLRRHCDGAIQGEPPAIDLALEAKLQRLLLELISATPDRLILSAHDVSDGGLAVALAECCVGASPHREPLGVAVKLPHGEPLPEALFGEAPSRVLVTTEPHRVPDVLHEAKRVGVPMTEIGTVGGDRLRLRRGGETLLDAGMDELRAQREACLVSIVGADELG